MGNSGPVTHDPAVSVGPPGAHHAERPYAGYWLFYDEVARRQLQDWLPEEPATVLDLSEGAGRHSATIAAAGHRVVRLVGHAEPPLEGDAREAEGIRRVVADPFRLTWARAGSFDAVVAESGALSRHLAAEATLGEIRQLLVAGGRLLLCVDSLVLGLARLAAQGAWAQLTDVPHADVVLIDNEDGSITRCFWPEELEIDLADAGFEVEWVRPRTVLSQDAVERALEHDPAALPTLVRTELSLSREREGESIGIHLLASARRLR